MENFNNNNERKSPEKAQYEPYFKADSQDFGSFVYKKTEKISSAIYIVSNLLPDQEPLKWHLRESGLSLLSQGLSLIAPFGHPQKEVIEVIRVLTIEILSKMQVAFFSGLVGEMNFLIFKKELEALLSLLQDKIAREFGGHYILASDFFQVQESSINTLPLPTSPTHNSYKGQDFIKDNVLYKKKTEIPAEKAHLRQSSHNFSKHNARKDMIIQFLGRVKEASIKDFSGVIKNCSEKTVQREIVDLVAQGVLKKIGERRWSRYSLA